MHDLIILGGGPAGLTAIHYALRKRLDALLVSDQLGGKTNYHMELPFNPPPQPILGADIVRQFRAQVEALGFALRETRAKAVIQHTDGFSVELEDGGQEQSRALIITTGAQPDPAGIPGEHQYLGRGVSYSSISHAPLFHHRTVAVIGQPDAGLRAAAELAAYANQVHLLSSGPFPPDSPMLPILERQPGVSFYRDAQPVAITGDDFARSLSYQQAGETKQLAIDGVFIERPLLPNTQIVDGLLQLDERGRILVNERNETSLVGCFAAGDVTATYGEQVLIAIGEGAKAALAAIEFLTQRGFLYANSA